jgi:ABC-type branched-subunit amino acid transport system substrate-binding protein
MLYIHHIAALDLEKKYSFSYQPSVEQVGEMAAQWIIKAHRTQKIGVVYRSSDNWEPGHRTFKAAVDRAGVNVVADLPVTQSQGVYTQQIGELQAKDAQVVFLWENALAADEIIKQAKNQGYEPTWVIFAFNQTTDTLGDDALSPPLEGIATWTSYSPAMTGAPYGAYSDVLKEFQAQLAKYGSGTKGNDVLWTTWLAWKQIYQLLLDCGPDCTRNEIVALLISGIEQTVSTTAGCPFDFSINGHVGGVHGDVFRTFRRPDDTVGWKPVPGEHCALTVSPPRVRPIQP